MEESSTIPTFVHHDVKLDGSSMMTGLNLQMHLMSYYYDGLDIDSLMYAFLINESTFSEFVRFVVDGYDGPHTKKKGTFLITHSDMTSLCTRNREGMSVPTQCMSNKGIVEIDDYSALFFLYFMSMPHICMTPDERVVRIGLEQMSLDPLPTERNRWTKDPIKRTLYRTPGSFSTPNHKKLPHVWLDFNTQEHVLSVMASKWPVHWGEFNIQYIAIEISKDTVYFAGSIFRTTHICTNLNSPGDTWHQWVHGESVTLMIERRLDKPMIQFTYPWEGKEFFLLLTFDDGKDPVLSFNNGIDMCVEPCVYTKQYMPEHTNSDEHDNNT